jgi:hypothetical protein
MGHIMFKIGYFGTTVGCVVGPLKVAASSGFGSTWQLHSSLTDHLFKIGKGDAAAVGGQNRYLHVYSQRMTGRCPCNRLPGTYTTAKRPVTRWYLKLFRDPLAKSVSLHT